MGIAVWSDSAGKPQNVSVSIAECAGSETLYAAFKPEMGNQKHVLYQWSLPEGGARHVAESIAHTCMATQCGRHFGLLGRLLCWAVHPCQWRLNDYSEPKRHCGGCGGVFCGYVSIHGMPIGRELTMVPVLTQYMLRRSPCGIAIRAECCSLKRRVQASLEIDAVRPCPARDEDHSHRVN